MRRVPYHSTIPDVGNALAALKKLVFDEKAIAPRTLLDALSENYASLGGEYLRNMLVRKAPKSATTTTMWMY
jgi:hypothetical protein